MPWYVKVDTLGRICNNNLERSYSCFNYQLILFYLKLYIISNFTFYLKPSLQLSPLKPLAYNWELVPCLIVCSKVQFPFASFYLEPIMREVLDFYSFCSSFTLTTWVSQFYFYKMPNFTQLSRVENKPETRTRSC